MALSLKGNGLFSRLKTLLTLQRFNHSLAENKAEAQFYAGAGSDSVLKQGQFDMSKWRKLDSRTLGITRSMISESSWIVLKVLQSAGFEAYLVGGCVRDLLLKKVPKDFDVITTAALRQIRKLFNDCKIVGRRYPICLVHVKGSVVEVSSFETVAEHSKDKEVVLKVPRGCDGKDFARWRNCMHRDFTINSLFFDPFVNKIYDYANAMPDLRFLKLRTLIPAQLSFEEDCARILRGLRLAARLGLSLSQETEIAIKRLAPSITSLSKDRIMMELNYMLSYGASEPSLSLLWSFKLLEILLPLHAAHLGQQTRNHQNSVMLMKLFSNLDKMVTCAQPSDCTLWIGLLAFHLALVKNPQDALVVWTFGSILYHGKWNEGVKFARAHALTPTVFIPEITEAYNLVSDDELTEKVSQLASAVQYSLGALSQTDNLLQLMVRFPSSPCSGLVFVPKAIKKRVSDLFNVLSHNIKSYKEKRYFNVDPKLLRKGDVRETRFVLGKIIMDTMSNGPIEGSEDAEEKDDILKYVSEEQIKVSGKKNKKRSLSPCDAESQMRAKRKMILKKCDIPEGRIVKRNEVFNTESDKSAKQKQDVVEQNEMENGCMSWISKEEKHQIVKNEKRQDGSVKNLKTMDDRSNVSREGPNVTTLLNPFGKSHLPADRTKQEKVSENKGGIKQKIEEPKKDVEGEKPKSQSLSRLFRR